jgi:hypothetical protein
LVLLRVSNARQKRQFRRWIIRSRIRLTDLHRSRKGDGMLVALLRWIGRRWHWGRGLWRVCLIRRWRDWLQGNVSGLGYKSAKKRNESNTYAEIPASVWSDIVSS